MNLEMVRATVVAIDKFNKLLEQGFKESDLYVHNGVTRTIKDHIQNAKSAQEAFMTWAE